MNGIFWKEPRIRLLTTLFFFTQLLYSQGGTWVWVKGSSAINPTVAYPVQGIADSSSNPPSLYAGASWIDKDGNFWVFGGSASFGSNHVYCDLWKYNPVSNIWIWVKGPGLQNQPGVYGTKGVSSPNNYPGSRSFSSTWTDNNGDLWLFGGYGLSAGQFGFLNDLWKYHIASNEWTWVHGSNATYNIEDSETDSIVFGIPEHPSAATTPGGLASAATWIDDNNNLWLFGGSITLNGGEYEFPYNDLWKYNISTNQWTLMNGPTLYINYGSYGTMGIENPTNLPPPREGAVTWKDSLGNFYLFGGGFIGEGGYSYYNNDVWRYNVLTNEWTWIGGDSTSNTSGSYQYYCSDSNNVPMSRAEHGTAPVLCSKANTALIFGGQHFGPLGQGTLSSLNDLWLFDNRRHTWKWISGSNSPTDTGYYGIEGVVNPANLPPARSYHCQWVDNHGTLWIFGGVHDPSATSEYNDVWKFIPDSICVQGAAVAGVYYSLSKNNICKGDTTLLTLIGDENIHVSPMESLVWLDSAHLLLYPDTTTTYQIHGQSYCGINDSTALTISVYSSFTVAITANDSLFCLGDSVVLSVPYGYANYQWSSGDTSSYIYAKQSGVYHVTVTENSNCSATSDTVSLNTYQTNPVPINRSGDTLIAHGETSYEWLRNDTVVLAANPNRNKYVAIQPGSYMVIGIDSNGCQVASIPVIISGISKVEMGVSRITIYPNPFDNVQTIVIENAEPEKVSIVLVDMEGRQLKNCFNGMLNQGINQFTIDLNGLPSGMYFYQIQDGQTLAVKKIIKM